MLIIFCIWIENVLNVCRRTFPCKYCSEEADRSRSQAEKMIKHLVDKILADNSALFGGCSADHSVCIDKGTKRNLDIYIPELRVGIEHDGAVWHGGDFPRWTEDDKKRMIEKDLEKGKLCVSNGITLIRIRELGCPELSSTSSTCIKAGWNSKNGIEASTENLQKVMQEIFEKIAECAKVKPSQVKVSLSNDDVAAARKIAQQATARYIITSYTNWGGRNRDGKQSSPITYSDWNTKAQPFRQKYLLDMTLDGEPYTDKKAFKEAVKKKIELLDYDEEVEFSFVSSSKQDGGKLSLRKYRFKRYREPDANEEPI